MMRCDPSRSYEMSRLDVHEAMRSVHPGQSHGGDKRMMRVKCHQVSWAKRAGRSGGTALDSAMIVRGAERDIR